MSLRVYFIHTKCFHLLCSATFSIGNFQGYSDYFSCACACRHGICESGASRKSINMLLHSKRFIDRIWSPAATYIIYLYRNLLTPVVLYTYILSDGILAATAFALLISPGMFLQWLQGHAIRDCTAHAVVLCQTSMYKNWSWNSLNNSDL